MNIPSIKKIQTEYVSTQPNSEYDGVSFLVNHEVKNSNHVLVRPDNPERWRSTEDAIHFYEWMIEEIRKLQKELGIIKRLQNINYPPKNKRVLVWVENFDYPFVGFHDGTEWMMETELLNYDRNKSDLSVTFFMFS